ncbi:glutaredoxin [Pseudohongiella sp. SYSU M77423]|uniref:Methylamine utilization protein MauE n=1 Tax=Pseudohongiella acticola TaxID=1524254 RepID=A0A1E8CJ43_9GAMM|nr:MULTISPECIES: glutaredoxin [Pseudohongiella]MAO39711.1 glutaredoxin [Pseudohongiella sp.]MAY54238.1 glutaredoxin [Gammaproteobacteria bacterium]MEC8859403.1 glutaredoxin [Pseudomonadota bacterium]MBJ55848.1 glutaredoxin [Gammaproteobacteria bacterium]MDH7942217.1 glutaredoxin [Pseudohongiella sp. SYSU M77423]
MSDSKTAELYRMVTEDHVCPYGLKSKHLLKTQGLQVEDHHLKDREEIEAFKAEHDVDTTPQTFIDGARIGGYDELQTYFGKEPTDEDETTYWPVISLFTTTFLMALGAASIAEGQWLSLRTFEWFIAFSMCALAYLKIRDVESFSTMFLNYDLLAQKWVPYGYVYPYGEGIAGVLMIAGVLNFVSIPIALVIGTVGAISVFKAVYIEKRELKCACVGGESNVPLGFISLTENLMMLGMGVWMLVKHSTLG